MTLKLKTPHESLNLYPHQEEAVNAIVKLMQKGVKAQILSLPTGAGKTETAAKIIQRCVDKGNKVAFICDRNVLIEQTSQRLNKYGIQHGILHADKSKNTEEQVVVCSAQTIERRCTDLNNFNLLIIDECHTQRKFINSYIKVAKPFVIGMTATPFTKGLGNTYQHVVCTRSTGELVDQGLLAPMRVMACTEINMDGVSLNSRGEWKDSETSQRIIEARGDIVSEWVKNTYAVFGKPVKTLVYAATVDDGESLERSFKSLGYKFRQVSYKSSNEHNSKMIEEFKKPDSKIVGLINCEMLVKGSDVPDVKILISARPYRKSLTSVLQMLGRGLRAHKDKEFCLLLDHSGNFLGFYDRIMDFWRNGPPSELNKERKEFKRNDSRSVKKETACKCGYIFAPTETQCPLCGTPRPKRQVQSVIYGEGEMREIDANMKKKAVPRGFENKKYAWEQISAIAMKRKEAWLFPSMKDQARRFALAQYKSIYNEWPKGAFSPKREVLIDPRVDSYVRSRVIRWARSKNRTQSDIRA